jgi:hypothetical protein
VTNDRRPPHDAPAATELLEAVRELLEGEVMEATEGRTRYQVRVAARVLSIVQREIEAGDEPSRAHEAGLARLGFSSDGALAAAIRAGSLDDRWEEVVDAVRATVADKLAVANPRYAGGSAEGSP